MLSHHVLFWLNDNTTETQKSAFRKGLESLQKIETIVNFYVATPAPIDRPVIDDTYTFSLLVFFEDVAGHDVYETHPLHLAFLEDFSSLFAKVVVYDSL